MYYNVKSGAWQAFMPPEMIDAFGTMSIAQAEHPAELTAYLLSGAAAGVSANLGKAFEERLLELLENSFE
jgi:hypothetical protein